MEQLCLCVVSGSGRRARCDLFLMQIYRTQLANTRPTSWKLHPIAHSLPFFPKELSCCVTMEIHDCWCWNALIIMGEKNPTLINYPDKLLCFFCLFSFPLVNRRRERPRTSWDLWRQVDVTSKPAIKEALKRAAGGGNTRANRKGRGWGSKW